MKNYKPHNDPRSNQNPDSTTNPSCSPTKKTRPRKNNKARKQFNGKEGWKTDLDLGFDIVNGIAALDLESDSLPSQRFHKDLHLLSFFLSFLRDAGWD
jgi:hypothetical protein